MKVEMCIFDLDGTLTRTQASIARACNLTLEHFGLPSMPVENYNYYAGDGLNMALKRALFDAGDEEGRCLEEGIPLCRQLFAEEPFFQVEVYPGIREALAFLKDEDIAIAVCSNKPHAQAAEVVEHFFGAAYFDQVRGQMEGVPVKPSPEGVFAILKEAGLSGDACLYFGDTNTDMLTGKNAGLYTVGVAWGFRPVSELLESGADRILHSALEIRDLVRELSGRGGAR